MENSTDTLFRYEFTHEVSEEQAERGHALANALIDVINDAGPAPPSITTYGLIALMVSVANAFRRDCPDVDWIKTFADNARAMQAHNLQQRRKVGEEKARKKRKRRRQ